MNIKAIVIVIFILLFNANIKAQEIKCMTALGNTLVVQTENDGVFIVAENGNKWLRATSGNQNTIVQMATLGSTLIAGSKYKGILLSDDNGNSWKQSNKGLPFKNSTTTTDYPEITCISIAGTTIFIGLKFADGTYRLYTSIDKGVTWVQNNSELSKYELSPIVSYGNTLFAGISTTIVKSGLYRSFDKGENWEKVNTGRNRDVSIGMLFINGSRLFLGNAAELYFLEINGDGGKVAEGPGAKCAFYSLLANGNTMYAGTSSVGASISTDNGLTWNTFNNGLEMSEQLHLNKGLALAQVGSTVYLVFINTLYSLPSGSDQWIKTNKGFEDFKVADKEAKELKKNADLAAAKMNEAADKIESEKRQKVWLQELTMKEAIRDYFDAVAEFKYANYDSAVAKFGRAIAAKPDFVKALEGRADCYNKLKKQEKEKDDRAALEKLKTSGSASVNNSFFTAEYKKYERLVNDTMSSEHLWSYYNDDRAWIRKAQEHYKKNELDEAVEAYNKAHKINKKNPKYEIYVSKEVTKVDCEQCKGKGYYMATHEKSETIYQRNTQAGKETSNAIGYEKKQVTENIRCEKCNLGKVKKKIFHSDIREVK